MLQHGIKMKADDNIICGEDFTDTTDIDRASLGELLIDNLTQAGNRICMVK
jgi:biotin operon repressor